jgi:hypothetical protein
MESGSRLELDGYCEELGIAFEHQGYQHYKKAHYSNTDKKFGDILKRDARKKFLCRKNGVVLILIPEIGTLTKIKNLKAFLSKEFKKNAIDIPNVPEIRIDWNAIYSPKDVESFSKLKDVITSKGGKLKSKEFLGLREKYLIECKNGHEWKACGNDIVFGNQTWCGICSKRVPHGIEKLTKFVESKGGKFLSKRYHNAHFKYRIECENGHEWKATASNLLNRGYWCPDCAILASEDKCCKAIICLETGIVYKSAAEAARKLKIGRPNISNTALGNRDNAGGFHFEFHKKNS